MLARPQNIDAVARLDVALNATRPADGGISGLFRFLIADAGLHREPVVAFAVLSSISRALLIFAVNEAAVRTQGRAGVLALLAVAVVATLAFAYLSRYRIHEAVERLQRNLRVAVSRRVLDADVRVLQQRDHGRVYAAVTHDTAETAGSLKYAIETFEAGLLLLICVPYLLWLSWPTAIAVAIALAIGTVGFVLTEFRARNFVDRGKIASARFFDSVDDMLSGWMELRLGRAKRDALERDVTARAEEVRHLFTASERLFTIGTVVTQAAMIALLCAIVVVLPAVQGLDVARMFQVLAVVLLAYGPVEAIFGALPRLSRAASARRRLVAVAQGLGEAHEMRSAAAPRDRFQTISLEAATVRLSETGAGGEEGFRLGPIDLTFRPGETVFICGGNGAGKSTLMALLTGLRVPDSGRLLLDGQPVEAAAVGDYRSLFSAVFSQFHLFETAYGLDARALAALDRRIGELDLADRVSLIENRFSTLQLSSGQKRRLALAVALAEDRPVIVLDEFAADQDPQRRAFFYDTLLPEIAGQGRLVIAVTHDEARFGQCDRLIRLDAGKVVSDVRTMRAAAAAG